jgi:hypothetical protein
MSGRIVWERLICISGIAMCVVSFYALDKLGFTETRGSFTKQHDVLHVATVFQIGLRLGLAAAVCGGIGWAISVRERVRPSVS